MRSLRFVIRHAGTLLPLSLVVGFLVITGDVLFFGENGLVGERFVVYLGALVATVLGLYACVQIARPSYRVDGKVSVFLYTLIVREAALLPVFFLLFVRTAEFIEVPAWLFFALFVPSALGVAASNLLLFASRKADVLEERISPFPFWCGKYRADERRVGKRDRRG